MQHTNLRLLCSTLTSNQSFPALVFSFKVSLWSKCWLQNWCNNEIISIFIVSLSLHSFCLSAQTVKSLGSGCYTILLSLLCVCVCVCVCVQAYEATFVQSIEHKHTLARRHFRQISVMAEYLDPQPAAALGNQLVCRSITMATGERTADTTEASAC